MNNQHDQRPSENVIYSSHCRIQIEMHCFNISQIVAQIFMLSTGEIKLAHIMQQIEFFQTNCEQSQQIHILKCVQYDDIFGVTYVEKYNFHFDTIDIFQIDDFWNRAKETNADNPNALLCIFRNECLSIENHVQSLLEFIFHFNQKLMDFHKFTAICVR